MKLRLELRPYRSALGRSVSNAQRSWREREGFLLECSDDEGGPVGQGEAAPLPGYSDEDLATVERALAPHVGRWFDAPEFEAIAAFVQGLTESKTARFGIETALLDWSARRSRAPLHRLLSAAAPSAPLPLAAWLDAESKPEVLAAARRALDAGFRTLKLKIGRPGAFDSELETIAALRTLAGTDVRIRLDANRAFPLAVGLERLRALTRFEIEFIEEPFERGVPLPASPPLAIALDESIAEGAPIQRERGVVALVLKPALQGGAFPTLALAARAARAGLVPILSHALEGPVGFAAACEIALACGSVPFAVGLAPHTGLAPWNAPLPAAIAGATLTPHAEPGLGLPPLKLLPSA